MFPSCVFCVQEGRLANAPAVTDLTVMAAGKTEGSEGYKRFIYFADLYSIFVLVDVGISPGLFPVYLNTLL